jgi:hypothetical protein
VDYEVERCVVACFKAQSYHVPAGTEVSYDMILEGEIRT